MLVFLKVCKIIVSARLCGVCAHTQTSLFVAPKLLVSLSSHEKCPNFRITSTPQDNELLSSEILDSSNIRTNKNLFMKLVFCANISVLYFLPSVYEYEVQGEIMFSLCVYIKSNLQINREP